MEIIKLPIETLTPDPNNAKEHPEWQIEQIKNSIEQFGNLDPIGVWGDDNLIVEGHGRYEALKELGYAEAECIRLDWLTEEERRAYALVHNKLTMNSGFIPEALDLNLDAVGEIDMNLFGFKLGDWFTNRERNDTDRQEGNNEYNEFLDKFEQKKTTDDCYTPDLIYDAVQEWVEKEYGVTRDDFVRPFYPGGDYEKFKYKPSAVVVDNPPFSIFSEIVKFYIKKEIKFFLFCSGLTPMSGANAGATIICCGVPVTYENGAIVSTSFATNMEDKECIIRTAPELYKLIDKANETIRKQDKKELTKNLYPDNCVTAAIANRYCKYGVEYKVSRRDSVIIDALDEQKEQGKGIYGNGLLLSERAAAERAAAERAAAERAAAERAAAEKWQLSERELSIVKSLGGE